MAKVFLHNFELEVFLLKWFFPFSFGCTNGFFLYFRQPVTETKNWARNKQNIQTIFIIKVLKRYFYILISLICKNCCQVQEIKHLWSELFTSDDFDKAVFFKEVFFKYWRIFILFWRFFYRNIILVVSIV